MVKEVLSKRVKKENKERLLKLEAVSNNRVNLDRLLEEILPEYESIYYSTNELLIKTKEELDESEERTKSIRNRYNLLKLKEEEEKSKSVINLEDENTIKALEVMKEDYEGYISEHTYKATDEEGFKNYFYDYNSFITYDIIQKFNLPYYKKAFLEGFKQWYLDNHDEY